MPGLLPGSSPDASTNPLKDFSRSELFDMIAYVKQYGTDEELILMAYYLADVIPDPPTLPLRPRKCNRPLVLFLYKAMIACEYFGLDLSKLPLQLLTVRVKESPQLSESDITQWGARER